MGTLNISLRHSVPENMPELGRFWADAGSIGPEQAHNCKFTGQNHIIDDTDRYIALVVRSVSY